MCAYCAQLMRSIGPSIDVCLLTHAKLSHLGLYAYARAHYGLQCPVYATYPVQALGRLATMEAAKSWAAEVDLKHSTAQRYVPTDAEIDDAFDAVRAVRYLQPTPLDGVYDCA